MTLTAVMQIEVSNMFKIIDITRLLILWRVGTYVVDILLTLARINDIIESMYVRYDTLVYVRRLCYVRTLFAYYNACM